ncbi:unnamed protein product [Didymodactylos carnosus]|uniref:Small G protein signaling modulator 1 n=1 Tax=Didymodactylos carnosus TaxID=1234261 RepID=A0A813ZIR7_9BILA|nr:unnamed protein product [Didymodactylos carnosus]CAF3683402.1 unnamed protein product [Didymodactylos carnosus]
MTLPPAIVNLKIYFDNSYFTTPIPTATVKLNIEIIKQKFTDWMDVVVEPSDQSFYAAQLRYFQGYRRRFENFVNPFGVNVKKFHVVSEQLPNNVSVTIRTPNLIGAFPDQNVNFNNKMNRASREERIDQVIPKTRFGQKEEVREKLLWNLKREVKQMMEEAVMKKCIHEENCNVTTLCAAVEVCLLHGLKRRAVGLFKTSTTMALLQKIAKQCPPAAEVVKTVDEIDSFSFSKKLSSITHHTTSVEETRRTLKAAWYTRYLWIRTALVNRSLHKIVDFIVRNGLKYYEPFALVTDSVQGPIFASLLAGPCALEFTKMKTSDHFWSDPPAAEIVQRHRMHSTRQPSSKLSPKMKPRLQMNLKRHASSSSEETRPAPPASNSARDYVESLHQNAKSQLIYGKNNVLVQPKEGQDPIPGYLSLHLTNNGVILKWTPNQLMNGYTSLNGNSGTGTEISESPKRTSVYWDYAISLNMSNVVYLHCHQHHRIVLVAKDGVQHPPFHIKDKGGHLLAFLSCLESGLAPNGKLDPPLWFEKGKGKIFPKLHRRNVQQQQGSQLSPTITASTTTSSDEEEEIGDYVFRIVFYQDRDIVKAKHWQWPTSLSLSSQNSSLPSTNTTLSSPSSGSSVSQTSPPPTTNSPSLTESFASSSVYSTQCASGIHKSVSVRTSIASLCDTMRRQILSRAFYGWIAYCRHLKTVRTHLAALIYPGTNLSDGEQDVSLSVEAWTELFIDRRIQHLSIDKREIYRRIYYGGCAPSIRKQVWPFLMMHYSFESTIEECEDIDRTTAENYKQLLIDWRDAEEIVRRLDRELYGDKGARLISSSLEPNDTIIVPVVSTVPPASDKTLLVRKDSSFSNDVFFEDCTVHSVVLPTEGESSRQTTPLCENQPIIANSTLIATTRTQSVIDRASPYNVIETRSGSNDGSETLTMERNLSTDSTQANENKDEDDNIGNDLNNDDQDQCSSEQQFHISSPDSSLTSSMDVYMDAVDILQEQDKKSDGSLTPVYYGRFSKEIIDLFSSNLHRIDKDVARCDRNYTYYSNLNNLKKLRNIMCTYVWNNLSLGYIQGMCDLVAPLLVIFDEEVITYSCFCYLMKRLVPNFPHGAGMDEHFANMRSLLQILDSELYEHIHRTGDFTHFYFCYRWFLLDFKREFVYDDIFRVWETIASARRLVSKRFVLFIALAMLKCYRDIILDNRMDFTDIIRFFNEMAERHDATEILRIARDLILELQKLIDNK